MKIGRIVSCLIISLGTAGPWVAAGKAASLAEELRQYYRPMKAEVVLAGTARPTLLWVRQSGLLRVAVADAPFLERCPSVFRSGQIRHSNDFFCSHLSSEPEKTLKLNERVYATDVVVNVKGDNVRLYLGTCNYCDESGQTANFRSLIVIEFSKGSLASASASTVIHTIDQLLAAEAPASGKAVEKTVPAPVRPAASAEPAAEKSAGAETPAVVAPAPASQPPIAAPRPAPVSTVLREGQTPDEVEQALGKPQKTYDMGARKIYIYTDIKVTFVDGKLTGIE